MDRSQVAKELREEAQKLIAAAALLEGSAPVRKRRVMSDETRQKMAESQQARHGKRGRPKGSAKKPEAAQQPDKQEKQTESAPV